MSKHLTADARRQIVQHLTHSMVIIDRNFPTIESKLDLIKRIQDHNMGRQQQPQEVVDGWLKLLAVMLYREVLDSDDITDE